MAETILVNSVFLDTDGYWKFSIVFDRGLSQAVHTFFYQSKAEADAQFSIANTNKFTLSDSASINSLAVVQTI